MTPPAALTPGALDEIRARHAGMDDDERASVRDVHALLADRDALAAKLGEAERERDNYKSRVEMLNRLLDCRPAEPEDVTNEINALTDELNCAHAALADLAKAREELGTAQAQVAALIAHRDKGAVAKPVYDIICVESQRLAEKLAALEARTADARMVCEWVVSGFGVVATAAVLDANNRAHAAARRYLANAPAAPAKADEMWPQLIEAVELLREAAPDSWWTPNRDDWRARRAALLAAIDAGRARAKETK